MIELVLATVFIAPIAVPCLIHGWKAWSGRKRAWAARPPAALIFTSRNVLPLQIGVGGMSMVLGIPALTSTFMGAERSEDVWFWTMLVVFPLIMYTHFWWPDFALPRWYKDWLRRGGQTMSETGEELIAPLWGPDEEPPSQAAS